MISLSSCFRYLALALFAWLSFVIPLQASWMPEFALEATPTDMDEVLLEWQAAAGSTGYVVERTGNFRNWEQVAIVDSATLAYTDMGLNTDTLYHYRVRSTGTTEVMSNWDYAATLIPVSSSDEVKRVVAMWEGSTVRIRWDERFADETGFRIERTANSNTVVLDTTAANITEYIDNSPVIGDSATYAVIAESAGGDSLPGTSAVANRLFYFNDHNQFFALSGTIDTSIAAPSNLQASWTDHNTVELTWDDNSSNESSFLLVRAWEEMGDYEQINSPSADATSYTFKGALSIAPYYFKIYAKGSGSDTSLSSDTIRLDPPSFDKTLGIPQNMTVVDTGSGIQINWDSVAGATSYIVESAYGNSEIRYETVATTSSNQYMDTNGTQFTDYRVRAVGAGGTGYPNLKKDSYISTGVYYPEVVPANFQLISNTYGEIELQWDVIPNFTRSYLVQRSMNGGPFEPVGAGKKVANDSTTVTWSDTSVHPGNIYLYRVGGKHSDRWNTVYTQPLQVTAAATVSGPSSPFNLTATGVSRTNIDLSWDAVQRAYSLSIERSLNSGSYEPLTTLNAHATSYTDTQLSEGDSAQYRVTAHSPLGNALMTSNNATTASTDPTITTATRVDLGYTILDVSGTAAADRIEITMSGEDIVLIVNGIAQSPISGIDEVQLRGLGGDDVLTVSSNVSIPSLLYGGDGNDTLTANGTAYQGVVAVGHGVDYVTGTGALANYWIDQAEIDTADVDHPVLNEDRVHRVSSFANGASKQLLGQDIADPTSYPSTLVTYPNRSLFGHAPTIYDVDQGGLQDCPFTCVYQGIAYKKPDVLYKLAVDLGDGTYAIRTDTGSIRIDGEFWTSYLSMAGPEGFIWWLILEKAYVNYSNPNYISPGLGRSINNYASTEADELFTSLQNELAQGNLITSFTPLGEINLHARMNAQHAHTLLHAYRDKDGTPLVIVRNPYGQQTEHNNNDLYDPHNGLITMTMEQVRANLATIGILDLFVDFSDPSAVAGEYYNTPDTDGDGSQSISLDAGVSSDSDGSIEVYVWSTMHNGMPYVSTGETASLDLPVGTHTVTLETIDDMSRRQQAQATIVVTEQGVEGLAYPSYWQWADTNALAGLLRGPLGDSDADGLANFMEYALGGLPNDIASTPAPLITLNGSNYDVSYHRAKPDSDYIVQTSTDMVNWVDVSTNAGTVGQDVSVQVPATSTPIFIRLKVEQ